MRCSAIYRTTSILSLCALIGCGGSGEDETDYSYGGSSSALSEQYSKSTWGPGGELGTGWVRGFVTEFSMAAVRAVRNTANFTNNVNWRGGRPLEAARVDYARSVGLTGAGQTIAIMDNAVRLSHETFDGVNVTHSSVSNLDARDDHGTAVASIAVGRGGTGIDAVEGVASGADLFLGTWDYQTGSTWNERAVMVSEADTAGAIVMNNSWQLSRDFNQSTFEYYFGQYSVASSYISAMQDYAQRGVVVFALSNYHDELDAYNVGALPLLYPDLEGSWITVVNGAACVCNAARNCLTDPPCCIGREFKTLTPVKLFDGVHQAKVAFLNEVEQWKTRCLILLGNRHHEAQVALYELTLCFSSIALVFAKFAATVWSNGLIVRFKFGGCLLAGFNCLRQTNFVVLGEEGVLADVGEIETD